MLAYFFTPAVAGYYALGNRVLRIPMSLIGRSVGQVFFQRAARARSEGNLTDLMEKVLTRYASFSLFPFALLFVLGPELFVFVFGAEWAEAGVFSQILSIWSFFWLMASSFSSLFYVLEKQDFMLKWNVWLLMTRIAALGLGGLSGDPRFAVGLFSVSGIVMYGYLCVAMVVYTKVPWSKLAWQLSQYLLVCIALVSPVFVSLRTADSIGVTFVIAAIATAAYYVVIGSRDQLVRQKLRHMRFRLVGS
jgi:O-antigen/teichoic acid export membrane protein